MKLPSVLILASVLATSVASMASAQAIVSTGQSFVNAHLLAGAATDDGGRLAGLRLSIADHWKTYWRSPGEAGIPPHLDWSGSSNVASVEVLWPRPSVFQSFGLRTVGYEGRLVLPVRIRAEDPSRAMHLNLEAILGVCRDVCIMEEVSLSETIEPEQRSIGLKQIRRALARVPRPAQEAGLQTGVCRISGAGRDRQLNARFSFDHLGPDAEVLIEGHENLWVRDIKVSQQAETVQVSATLRTPSDVTWVDRSTVRMTVLADGFAADIQGCNAG